MPACFRSIAALLLVLCGFGSTLSRHADAADQPVFPMAAKRILFMGDSITHAGHYVAWIDARLRTSRLKHVPELINLGLPSETCSGLSEPDHPFPRPDMHERFQRALERVKPDVVVACYGMNDGIYYPFSEERFAAYQSGVTRIIQAVRQTDAKLILMTPPAFDPLPLKQQGRLLPAGADKYAWFSIYEGYDDVLKRYAAWIMEQRDRVDMVIDLHTPVTEYVAAKRSTDPGFTMSPDGVHVNEEGHRVLAKTILRAWGLSTDDVDPELLKLTTRRTAILHDAWLSHVGHKRPGVPDGLPLAEAEQQAAAIDRQIATLLTPGTTD